MYYRKHYDKHKCKKKLQEGRRHRPSGYYYKEDGKGEIYYYRHYWSTTRAIMKRMTNKVVRKLKNNIVTNIRPGEYRNHHDDWCYW
jgi:hypothetical protein